MAENSRSEHGKFGGQRIEIYQIFLVNKLHHMIYRNSRRELLSNCVLNEPCQIGTRGGFSLPLAAVRWAAYAATSPSSGRKARYRPVQISRATSVFVIRFEEALARQRLGLLNAEEAAEALAMSGHRIVGVVLTRAVQNPSTDRLLALGAASVNGSR